MYVGTGSEAIKEVQFVGSTPTPEPSNPLINGNVTLGNVVTLANSDVKWKIVHVDSENSEVVLCKEIVEEELTFCDEITDTYATSNLIQKCEIYEQSLPRAILEQCISITVHGAVSKIWVPQCNWISSKQPHDDSGINNTWTQFDYFTDNNSRIALNAFGTAMSWLTASLWKNGNPYDVSTDGGVYNNHFANVCTFRPFICLPLS